MKLHIQSFLEEGNNLIGCGGKRDDNKYNNSFSNMLFFMSNGNVYSYELKEKE